MTTTWGADPAPHIAYQLTAHAAREEETAVAVLWLSLDGAGRARVVAALGAQARAAADGSGLADAAEQLGAELRNCEDRQAALDALAGCPAAELLPCDGCARPALALARARMRALARYGFCPAAVAEICRRAAAL